VLLAIVAVCCLGTWLAKGWLYPNRILGRHIALIGPMDTTTMESTIVPGLRR